LCTVCALVLPASFLVADITQVVAEAETLHDHGKYAEAKAILLESVKTASGREASELYWRASRETEELGDAADKEKKPMKQVLPFFEEGEEYADKAIQADPEFDMGYFWKSVAILGRLGQVRGVLNALTQVGPIRELLFKVLSLNPDRALAWFVLGQMYRELPGWPISFGNTDAAVSLGRKAVELNSSQVQAGEERGASYNFQVELARTLYQRNWSASKRLAEQKKKAEMIPKAATTFETGALFEATVSLEDESDRQEAKSIVRQVIFTMEALPELTASQSRDLKKAKQTLAKW
jgi:tetratricopeptide (TPR) repeat protein